MIIAYPTTWNLQVTLYSLLSLYDKNRVYILKKNDTKNTKSGSCVLCIILNFHRIFKIRVFCICQPWFVFVSCMRIPHWYLVSMFSRCFHVCCFSRSVLFTRRFQFGGLYSSCGHSGPTHVLDRLRF